MQIMIMLGIVFCCITSARAELVTHSGMLRSMKNGKIILIERGSENNLEYSKIAVCYMGGKEVPCSRIRVNSQVRVDCPDNKACVRVIVDQAAR